MADKTNSPKPIHSGHRLRLKRSFLQNGIDTFENHQILEMLLFYGIPQMDTNPIAHRLLNKFGSLDKVFDAPLSELMKIEGIGENTATLIKFIPSLSRKYNESKKIKKTRIFSYEQIVEIFQTKFIGVEIEQVLIMLLGSDGSLLYCGKVNEGSVNTVAIYIRRILNLALTYDADTVILAHNHPSGNAMPSSNDISATRDIHTALTASGFHFEDHIIIAGNEYCSLKQSGWLNRLTSSESDPKEVDLRLKEENDLKKKCEKGILPINKKKT